MHWLSLWEICWHAGVSFYLPLHGGTLSHLCSFLEKCILSVSEIPVPEAVTDYTPQWEAAPAYSGADLALCCSRCCFLGCLWLPSFCYSCKLGWWWTELLVLLGGIVLFRWFCGLVATGTFVVVEELLLASRFFYVYYLMWTLPGWPSVTWNRHTCLYCWLPLHYHLGTDCLLVFFFCTSILYYLFHAFSALYTSHIYIYRFWVLLPVTCRTCLPCTNMFFSISLLPPSLLPFSNLWILHTLFLYGFCGFGPGLHFP
jgi:hypothetical protein